MKLSPSTNSGLNYDYNKGGLTYGNPGVKLTDISEFLGLARKFNIQNGFPLPQKPTNSDINKSEEEVLNNKILSLEALLASISPYEQTSEGHELKNNSVVYCIDIQDQFTDKYKLSQMLYKVPQGSDVDDAATNPSILTRSTEPGFLTKIPKSFDSDLNIVDWIVPEDLRYICKYKSYDLSGNLMGTGLISGAVIDLETGHNKEFDGPEYENPLDNPKEYILKIPESNLGYLNKIESIVIKYVKSVSQ